MRLRSVILAAIAALGLTALALWWFAPTLLEDAQHLLDRDALEALVARVGVWGPILIVSLMTVAVVASPLPSAPIALAAGAAYGHLWGTVLVILGAELGAVIAFGIARALGRDAVLRWFSPSVHAGLLGSQNALTGAVFISRLLPFVSFDMMSYAAGLSALRFWRFTLATFAGTVPASFLLAHFGNEAVSGEAGRAGWAILGLGLVTGLPLLWIATRRRTKSKTD